MRSSPARLAIMFLVFLAGLGGALALLRSSNGTDDARDSASAAPASTIWKVGDAWTVNVRQDAGAITPDGDTSIATIPFRFEVTEAPQDATGTWTVHVTQDGAEGPFAKGWMLQYRAKSADQMDLFKVAVGSEPPLEVELASIVLGAQFPYELKYTAPPKDATIDAAKLVKRASLPPSEVPGSAPPADPADDPATPPATAPPLPDSSTTPSGDIAPPPSRG